MMYRIALGCLCALSMCAAEKPKALTVPADAKQIAPYTYRHTDKAGKVWIYRQGPFGLSRAEEVPEEKAREARPVPAAKLAVVGEEDDQIRFSAPGPFGPTTYTKKKSELTPAETVAWEQKAVKTSDAKK